MMKIKWDVEEIVALIDVYKRCNSKPKAIIDSELETLSRWLNIRANQLGIVHDEKFRNINGMNIMYQNIVYIATDGSQGMSNASASLYAVYRMSITAPDVFELILKEFKKRYCKTV